MYIWIMLIISSLYQSVMAHALAIASQAGTSRAGGGVPDYAYY